jgi:hypothetical protein
MTVQRIAKDLGRSVLSGLLVMFLISPCVAVAAQSTDNSQANGVRMLEQFDQQQVKKVKGTGAISEHEKQVIIFALGAPLAVLLLITGGLGIATGVYGKELFVPHMIFAGLTITLAFAHVIVGLVWFFPF